MPNQSQWCIHFHYDSVTVRVEDARPEIGYNEAGIYEVVPVGKCTARKMRNVRQIPQCEVPPGRGGCRRFEPGEPVFEYNPTARLWMRYLGPLSDPQAEAEAKWIEARQKERER